MSLSSPAPVSQADHFEEEAILILRKNGYRITMPRIQVVRAMASSGIPLTAYRINEIIKEDRGRIDVVSIYRILRVLHDVGLVLDTGEGFMMDKFRDPKWAVIRHESDGTCTQLKANTSLIVLDQDYGPFAKALIILRVQ